MENENSILSTHNTTIKQIIPNSEDFKMLAMAVRFKKLQNLRTLIGNRSFATAMITDTESNDSSKKETLYSRISPLGNPKLAMTTELDDWIGKGNKVRHSELKQIIHGLRKRRRFRHALEVSEWINKNGIFAFTPETMRSSWTLSVRGFLEAEIYLNSLTEQDKTDKTYGALLHCYVRQHETEKALSHFEKMKEKGFGLSSVPYNDIMWLHLRVHQTNKVRDVLNDMKKNGVSPDNLTYRMCINSYAEILYIERMEEILAEMQKDPNIVMDWNTYTAVAIGYVKGRLIDKAKNALTEAENRVGKDAIGYNHLITIHARLGNKDDVLRLLDRLKSLCKRRVNREYITTLRSLVRIDEFEEAEKLLAEWRSSGNFYDFRVPLVVVEGYLENDSFDKATILLDSLLKDGKWTTADSWWQAAFGFLEKCEIEKSGGCLETSDSLPVEKKDWKMDLKVVEKLLDGVGEKESVQNVEWFVWKLKKFVAFDRGMYHRLMRAYINGGKEVGKVLDDMKADGIEEDEETKRIVELLQKESTSDSFAKPFTLKNPSSTIKPKSSPISEAFHFKMLAMAVRFRKLQNVRTLIGNRSLATATITQSESDNSSKKNKKASLYSRISPLGNPNLAMTPELDDWIGKGNKVRNSELKQIIHDLRKRRRFHHALE
ncbi:LOW QUALITY PROTEIN: hypothetical protein OSB04_001963, partial [Centaurea solstitialis]